MTFLVLNTIRLKPYRTLFGSGHQIFSPPAEAEAGEPSKCCYLLNIGDFSLCASHGLSAVFSRHTKLLPSITVAVPR